MTLKQDKIKWPEPDSNTTCLFLCLCENVAPALFWQPQGKRTQTEWQVEMWRGSGLSARVLWTSASGGSEPACPLLLHMTPLRVGRSGLRAMTEPPDSSYICPTCHSGTQLLSEKIHYMHEQQPQVQLFQHKCLQRETKQRVGVSQGPPGFDLFVHMWSNIVNYQLFKELNALQISWIQCYLYSAKSLSYIISRQINIVRLRPQKL